MATLPFYARYVIALLGFVLLFVVLYMGSPIIIPVYMGLLFSLVMLPVSNMLERRNVSRGFAALICILIVFLVFVFLGYFISTQVSAMSEDADKLSERITEFINEGREFLDETLGINSAEQEQYIQQLKEHGMAFFSGLGGVASSLFIASVLLPMSMYFFMVNRSHYKNFFLKLYADDQHETLEQLFEREKKIVLKYLTGIIGVIIILSICNVTALTIFGLDHALLFGVLAAVLNVIPLVGTIVGSMLPILYALIINDNIFFAVGIGLYFWGIQILESSIITPNFVGNRVRVNPFAILIAIFVGGQLWGPIGMVLFIPMVAQLKSLCTVVPPLQPYGYLLRDPNAGREGKLVQWLRRKFSRNKDDSAG